MDQQNYYYGKHNIGSLNYHQSVFGNSGSEYQATGYSEHPPLHHSTGLNFTNQNSSTTTSNHTNTNTNSSTATNNSTCGHLSNTASAANLSRSANNNLSANTPTNEYNAVSYSRLYSYIPDNTVQNVSSAPTNTQSDCNNITYGSAFNSKSSYETTTNSAHVPVIAVTSNNSHTRGYHHSNISYGSYQNADYSLHKTLSQNYPASGSMGGPASSTQNRPALNASTAFAPMEHHVQQPSAKSRTNTVPDGKTSAKTSVIKPLNAYNTATPASAAGSTPINYTKYPVPVYPANNNKTASNLEKSPSTVNRGMYATNKNADVYCPEPISAARYPNHGYAINATTPATGHTNSHYLAAAANTYPLNYGHHYLTQHQNSVPHHSRNLLSASAYHQASLDESNYFNRQNGLVVRPTPNTYKQPQLQYPNTYSYGRSNVISSASGASANHSSNSHSTLPKPQSQKPVDDSYNPLALDFDSTYERRNSFRSYSSMYGSTYIDPTGYDDYPQYSGFAPTNSVAVPNFYSPKPSSKHLLYNHNSGLNVYNNNAAAAAASHPPSLTQQTSSQSVVPTTTSSSVPTTSMSTVVQQPVPINPSSSQLISSNYDATSLHAHPILPPSLFNNNNKEYCATNQYQQNPYASQILYSTLQNGGYYHPKSNQSPLFPAHSNEVHSVGHDKGSAEKTTMPPQQQQHHHHHHGKYNVIDLEEQINSSKISKVAGGPVVPNPKHHARVNNYAAKMPVINVQDGLRQRKSGSSQIPIESNRNAYNYNSNTLSVYPASNFYQTQQQWQKTVSQNVTMPTASTSITTHLHPKKQSLRDFLSTWNEDEEEEVDATSKKSPSNSHSHLSSKGAPPHLANSKPMRPDKSNKLNENVPVIVQPIHPIAHNPMHASHLQPGRLPPPPTYPGLPIPNAAIIPPKIHIGVTVDNGSQNLPDIIIDIEKTKPADEGEGSSFERTNGKKKLNFLLKFFALKIFIVKYFCVLFFCCSNSRSSKTIRKTLRSQ